MRGPHQGMDYIEFLSQLSSLRQTDSYLEIGVNAGKQLAMIHSRTAIGVDPAFVLTHDVTLNKSLVELHRRTSDEFFRELDAERCFDLIFLDGLHLFEVLLRDFINSERHSHFRSLIVMHDCLPMSAEMADRDMATGVTRGADTPYAGMWTGDVWKIIPILRTFRPDLKISYVDCPPTGLVCVSGLDRTSRVLGDAYTRIVEEFAATPNTMEQIDAALEDLQVRSSRSFFAADPLVAAEM